MIEQIVIVVGLNEKGQGLELRHEIAHQIAFYWSCLHRRRLDRRFALVLYLCHRWPHSAEPASRVAPLHMQTGRTQKMKGHITTKTLLPTEQADQPTVKFASATSIGERNKIALHLSDQVLGNISAADGINTRNTTACCRRRVDG